MPKLTPVLFISSTKEDLEAHRAAVRDAAMAAGLRVEMMEYWAAQGKLKPYPACMQKVEECDVLVAIVAHRYGWVPADQPAPGGKSITWLEVEHARSKGIEVLAFVVDEKFTWPAEVRESYRLAKAAEEGRYSSTLSREVNRNVKQLGEFKKMLGGAGFRPSFTTADDLRAQAGAALREWLAGQNFAVAAPAAAGDPAKYLEAFREATAWIDIRGLAVGSGRAHRFAIEDLYMPLTTVGGGERRVRLEEALRHRRLVIVGDPGSGKSTFLRKIGHGYTDGFPILIRIAELQEFIANCDAKSEKGAPKTGNSAGWLSHFLASQQFGLDAAFFEQRLGEKTTLVMLDGLDEAPNRTDREAMARLFEKATEAYKQCRFVVTTRPGTYTDDSTLAGFEQVRIDDLEAESVEGFLAAWSRCLHPSNPAGAESHKKELVSALKAKPEIRRMARNPVMLTALAVVHWNERRMPEQRAELYESVLTWLARSREQRKGRETAERCLALLGQLALAMQDQKKGRLTEVAKGRAAEMLAPQFPGGFEAAMSFLEQEETDSGIIVSRGGDVRFWHLTFQEYLTARAIAGMPDAAQQELLLKQGKLYRQEWREVMRLLGGVLHTKQGAGKVDGLFSAVLDRMGKHAIPCAGLLGSMLTDLRALGYEPSDPRYEELMRSVLAVFTVEGSKGIPLKQRVEAAEALGAAGDPRLRLPGDKDYWVRIEGPSGPFLIGKCPVTVEEFSRFVDDGGKEPEKWEDQQRHPSRPVVRVSWHAAKAYCEWAGVRLPTEAEWYAAAAGREKREYPWGAEEPDESRANYAEKVGAPSPVGLFPCGATPEGVLDMAGNVWEWMENDYHGGKELRGGAYVYDAQFLRAAFRSVSHPDFRVVSLGFRCVREVFS